MDTSEKIYLFIVIVVLGIAIAIYIPIVRMDCDELIERYRRLTAKDMPARCLFPNHNNNETTN